MPREYRTLDISDYEITRDGQVINKHTGRPVKGQPNGKGYLRVCISGKLQFIHRLVAQRYIPNPENKPQVNHIDGNKCNNSVENLEWVTNKENRKHAVEKHLHLGGEDCPWAKLSANDVKEIRAKYPNLSQARLAEMYHVSPITIHDIVKGKTWKQLKRYAELT